MADGGARRVLVTGVTGPIAMALVRRLERDDSVEYLAGLDTEAPEGLERTEFVRGDLRSPVVSRVIDSARIDTVVHLGLTTTARQAGGRARMKELNVIGTMQLLAAAQKAPRVRQVVVRSSTAVYGSSPRNPALLPEDASVSPPRSGYAKDTLEVEGYARRLGRRRNDISVTVLRLANMVGPTVESPLTMYFSLPVVPTLLGYDPRLQLLHEDDAVTAFEAATLAPHPGIYNVGGPGAMYLSQAARLAGRPTVPVVKQLMPGVASALRAMGLVDFSADQLPFLLHGRVVDTSRLRDRFGLVCRYSTREAFEDFLAVCGIEPFLDPDLYARAERWGLRVLAGQEQAR